MSRRSFFPLLLIAFQAIAVARSLIAQTSTPIPPAQRTDASPSEVDSAFGATPPAQEPLVSAVLSREPDGEATDVFSTETPKLYLRWNSQGLTPGDKLHCIWIAEDVGDAAPANYHVDEASATASVANASGLFTVSKPKAGWPAGRYRVEIYLGDKVRVTLPFAIEEHRGD